MDRSLIVSVCTLLEEVTVTYGSRIRICGSQVQLRINDIFNEYNSRMRFASIIYKNMAAFMRAVLITVNARLVRIL